ncbi:MAG: hypothetical protein WBP58_10740 [Chitinophagaceae bacterium]
MPYWLGHLGSSSIMRIAYVLVVIFLFSCEDDSSVKTYIGLEELGCYTNFKGEKECYIDSSIPNYKWFRLSTIRLQKDSVFLDQSPVAIFNSDTIYSVSNGGFYYYKGKYENLNDSLILRLEIDHCDYCPVPIKANKAFSTKILTAKRKGKDLLINGYLFTPKTGM